MGSEQIEGPLLAGVDIGSSSVRALIFDASGRQVAVAQVPTPTVTPRPGWTEFEPEAIWQAAVRVLREATSAVPGDQPVAGVAAASVGESIVLIDESGRPLHNAIAWYDNRTADIADKLEAQLGRQRVFDTTGLFVDPFFGLCKLIWLRAQHPDLLPRTHRFLPLADWIAYRLSGVVATDPSLASRTLAFDIHRRDWSTELLAEVDLRPSIYPPIQANGTALGPVTKEAAEATGLSRDTIVGVGGHDHVLGAVALGVSRPELMLDSMGTAEALYFSLSAPVGNPALAERGYTQGAVHTDRPSYYMFGGIYSSGASIDWFRRAVAPGIDHAELIAGGRDVAPAADGLIFVPHVHHAGSPHRDNRARGAFVGLRPHMGRASLYRAVLEGLAMEARLVVDGVAGELGIPAEIRVAGGNARNDLLLEIKASVYGRALSVMPVTESTTLGAAILGGLAAGVYPNLTEAQRAVAGPAPRIVAPNPEWVDRYEALYDGVYRQAYAALRPLSHGLDGLASGQL